MVVLVVVVVLLLLMMMTMMLMRLLMMMMLMLMRLLMMMLLLLMMMMMMMMMLMEVFFFIALFPGLPNSPSFKKLHCFPGTFASGASRSCPKPCRRRLLWETGTTLAYRKGLNHYL